MPKVKPSIVKTFDFFRSVISTLQNVKHYNNYNYNKNELYAQKSLQQKKKGITLRDTLLV